jgi:hypothetical protein
MQRWIIRYPQVVEREPWPATMRQKVMGRSAVNVTTALPFGAGQAIILKGGVRDAVACQ